MRRESFQAGSCLSREGLDIRNEIIDPGREGRGVADVNLQG